MINPSHPNYESTPVQLLAACWPYQPKESPQAQSPLVTIVSPFHNTGPEFSETVAVVLRQSLQNWEWIIVNDCSTDEEALQRLRQVEAGQPRIRVIHLPENRGPGHARNTGIAAARADYIFQLDADDLIEPTAIEKLLWFLVVNPQFEFARGYDVGFGAEAYLWNKGFHCGADFLGENLVQTNSLVRKSVFLCTGGYDETIKDGFEDWDFWLRCASQGLWGGTLPEYLHWYRRRANHADKWKDFESAERISIFREKLLKRYENLTPQNFPKTPVRSHDQYCTPSFRPQLENPLTRSRRRLLVIAPHMEMGGADKFNLDLIRQLQQRHEWEVTVVTTLNNSASWYHHFTELTSDVFVLRNFLQLQDFPAFFAYLIKSRGYDAVLITNSTYGYNLLPVIRSSFPSLPVLDYVHMEEEYWRSGGYARFSVNYAPLLDGTLVSSRHLRNWMIQRGHHPDKITVAYTNIDPLVWRRNEEQAQVAMARWNLNPSAVRVLFAGRLCDQKQPDVFLRVARTLLDEKQNVQFIVAGNGPSRSEFDQVADQYPADQFRMVGAVSSAEIHQLLSCADIFFLPSKMEGIALAMFEAMSMEVVPVGAAVGGQAELINPDCGILIERSGDEVQKYCEAIRLLSDNINLRNRMAKRARQHILDHHSLDILGDNIHRLLCLPVSRPIDSRPSDSSLAELFVVEITEQYRLEQLANSLWQERNQLQLIKRKHLTTELAVFMDTGRGYNEQDSIKREVEVGRDLDVWIPLPHPVSGGRLRIDPAACMGTVTILAIYLRWKTENLAFWKADNPGSLGESIECAGTAIAATEGNQFQLISHGHDPFFFLPYVLPDDPAARVMLQIKYRVDLELPASFVRKP